MYAVMLRTQWERAKGLLSVLIAVALVVPWWTLVRGQQITAVTTYGDLQYRLMEQSSKAMTYPLLALFTGVLLAWTTWTPDTQGNHVYALSLPVSRARYVLLRFGAGAALALSVVVGLFVSALTATLLTPVPAGLHRYPTLLSLRFALATLSSFAIVFALRSAPPKIGFRIALVLLAPVALFIVIGMAGGPTFWLERALTALWGGRWGLFGIFAGEWRLLDL